MKKARSLSEKWRFIAKNRRCNDCGLALSSAASMSASSSGRKRANFDRAAVAQVLWCTVADVTDMRAPVSRGRARHLPTRPWASRPVMVA